MPTAAQVDFEIARNMRSVFMATVNSGLSMGYGTFWSGTYPGGSGRACDNTTPGALMQPAANDSSRLIYLYVPMAQAITALWLVDRLIDVSGFSAQSTSLQTITHPALTRSTDGAFVNPWIEIVTAAASAPAADLTLNYINQAGNPKQSVTSLAAGWATTVRRANPINLAPGDWGIRSLTSWQLSAGAPTAGNVAWVLGRMIQFSSQSSSAIATSYQRPNQVHALRGGLPRVRAGACVTAFGAGNLTIIGNMIMNYALSESLG